MTLRPRTPPSRRAQRGAAFRSPLPGTCPRRRWRTLLLGFRPAARTWRARRPRRLLRRRETPHTGGPRSRTWRPPTRAPGATARENAGRRFPATTARASGAIPPHLQATRAGRGPRWFPSSCRGGAPSGRSLFASRSPFRIPATRSRPEVANIDIGRRSILHAAPLAVVSLGPKSRRVVAEPGQTLLAARFGGRSLTLCGRPSTIRRTYRSLFATE